MNDNKKALLVTVIIIIVAFIIASLIAFCLLHFTIGDSFKPVEGLTLWQEFFYYLTE